MSSRLSTLPALSRRVTVYQGLFGNVTSLEADAAKLLMDDILAAGHQNMVVSILFAFLSIMFFMSVRTLLAAGIPRRSNKWMLAALTLMYGCTVVSYALDLVALKTKIRATTYDLTGRYGSNTNLLATFTDIVGYITQGINILIGDLVILWRTSIVWHNSIFMRRINLTVAVLIVFIWIPGVATIASLGAHKLLLIPLTMSLTVNLWSTMTIGYKTWHHRRMLQQRIFMAGRSSGSSVERALAVLTETGIVYTALYIINVVIVAYYVLAPNAYTEVMLNRAFTWTWMIMSMLIPLYPILLILLIARHRTPLTEALTSIDVLTSVEVGTVAASLSASSITDDAERQAELISDDKVEDAYHDPYATAPDLSGVARLEPNRRT